MPAFKESTIQLLVYQPKYNVQTHSAYEGAVKRWYADYKKTVMMFHRAYFVTILGSAMVPIIKAG